jgi:hypothetical protein
MYYGIVMQGHPVFGHPHFGILLSVSYFFLSDVPEFCGSHQLPHGGLSFTLGVVRKHQILSHDNVSDKVHATTCSTDELTTNPAMVITLFLQ